MTEKTWPSSFSSVLTTEEQTAKLAEQLAHSISQLAQHDSALQLHISLIGDLGAGKTTFTRYLLKSLGHSGKVKSPTYALCEPYDLAINSHRLSIHHFDLYRMRGPLEWQEAGFAEYFDLPGFCLIEWPEKANGTLPPFDLQIELLAGKEEDERSIKILALLSDGSEILQDIASNA